MVDGCGVSYTVKRRVEAAGRREVCLGVSRLLFLCQLIAGVVVLSRYPRRFFAAC